MAHQNQAALYRTLCRELADAENLAELQPLMRARQLWVSEPGRALIAIAVHVRSTWPAYVVAVGTQRLGLGLARELAQQCAAASYALVGRWREPQRAYRHTLTELHRGLQCALLLRELASTVRETRVVRWCDDMIPRRAELIAHAEQALGWFATSMGRATVRPPTRLRLSVMQSGAW